ncbi:hypothetical protein KDK_01570 [Dictyobacter kobayashii]|uniref:Uncharacterized protein n=1 Tax=Dictyobacter kobayashii TaxID=2014872 RepID=A0A402AB29_9CHLR|nr:hypothetical protein KDK_01570 [Dictyobacter kobayashii]
MPYKNKYVTQGIDLTKSYKFLCRAFFRCDSGNLQNYKANPGTWLVFSLKQGKEIEGIIRIVI